MPYYESQEEMERYEIRALFAGFLKGDIHTVFGEHVSDNAEDS